MNCLILMPSMVTIKTTNGPAIRSNVYTIDVK